MLVFLLLTLAASHALCTAGLGDDCRVLPSATSCLGYQEIDDSSLMQKTGALTVTSSEAGQEANLDLAELPDPRQEKAEKMIKKFQGIIDEMNLTVLQCTEGIERLNSIIKENPYVINAMIPFVGKIAMGCHLNKPGLPVHLHPPTSHQETCVFYCGESDCPAALTYISHAKAKLKKYCNSILYLQGGALCFLEHDEPVKSRDDCLQITTGHDRSEFKKLVNELNITELGCGEGVQMLTSAQGSNHYVINMMVSVFGEIAKTCNLADTLVNDDVPTVHQETCVLYCGESHCPIALNFLIAKKKLLREKCDNLIFIHNGATCFLEKELALSNSTQCRAIVAPEPE